MDCPLPPASQSNKRANKKRKKQAPATKKKESKKKNCIQSRYNLLRRWKISLTCLLEMFQARGYTTNPSIIRRMIHHDFTQVVQTLWQTNIGFVFDIPKPNQHGHTKICFYRSENVGINDMRNVLQCLLPCSHIVVVVEIESKPAVHEFIKTHKTMVKIEIFTMDELSFNLLKHKLVPNHRLLTHTEVDCLLQRYKLKSVHVLNKMLITDPVARYYGVGVGHVFEITRPTPEGHSFHTWRVVSNVPLK